MKRLGVNIDHVATIRNARGEFHPDPTLIGKLAISYGANSITIHLRNPGPHKLLQEIIVMLVSWG